MVNRRFPNFLQKINAKLTYLLVLIVLSIGGVLTYRYWWLPKQKASNVQKFQEQRGKAIKFSFEDCLKKANEYLQTNQYFKSFNLIAEPSNYKNAREAKSYSIKPKYESLKYEFILKPRNEVINEIKMGRIWIDAITGKVNFAEVSYKTEQPSEAKLSEKEGLQKAVDVASLANNINVKEPNFELKVNKKAPGVAYAFSWQESINGILLPHIVQVMLDNDGRFVKHIYSWAPIEVSLEPTIKEANAKKIAKNLFKGEYDLEESNMEILDEKLSVLTNPLEIPCAKQSLVWIIDIKLLQGPSELNMSIAHYYIDAHTGEKIHMEYLPARIY